MLDPVLAGLFLLEYGHIFSLGIFIDLPMQFARFTNETLLRPGLEAELSAPTHHTLDGSFVELRLGPLQFAKMVGQVYAASLRAKTLHGEASS